MRRKFNRSHVAPSATRTNISRCNDVVLLRTVSRTKEIMLTRVLASVSRCHYCTTIKRSLCPLECTRSMHAARCRRFDNTVKFARAWRNDRRKKMGSSEHASELYVARNDLYMYIYVHTCMFLIRSQFRRPCIRARIRAKSKSSVDFIIERKI